MQRQNRKAATLGAHRQTTARRPRRASWRLALPAGLLFCLLPLFACDDISESEHIERAQTAIDKGEVEAGIIELKNALQKNPENPTARLLLGESYLRLAKFRSAEKELTRAMELGAARKRSLEALGTAWLRLENYQEILERFPNKEELSREGSVNSLLIRAMAHIGLVDFPSAVEAFNAALESDPDNLAVLIGLTSSYLSLGQLDAAQKVLSRASGLAPDQPKVLSLAGALELRRGDTQKALEYFEALSQQDPRNFTARLALSQLYASRGDTQEALRQADAALTLLPGHTGANFLRALLSIKVSDYESALSHSERVLLGKRNDIASLLVAAIASYKLDLPQKAHKHLTHILELHPDHPTALKAIAAVETQLRVKDLDTPELVTLLDGSGDDEKSLLEVDPALKRKTLLSVTSTLWHKNARKTEDPLLSDDCAGLRESVEAYNVQEEERALWLLSGHWEATSSRGECRFELLKALDTRLQEGALEVSGALLLAQLNLMVGRESAAAFLLNRLQSAQPENRQVIILQALTHLLRSEARQAKANLRSLLSREDPTPEAHFLLAQVHEALGEEEKAQNELQAALQQNGNFIEPGLELARRSLKNGKLAEARERLAPMLELNPAPAGALELSALAFNLEGERTKAATEMEKALAATPSPARVLKLAILLENADAKEKALGALAAWITSHPADASVRLALANRLLKAGRLAAARAQYVKVLEQQPLNVVALNNLAWTDLKSGHAQAALARIKPAINLAPHNADILHTAGLAALEAGKTSEAIAYLEDATGRQPGNLAFHIDLAKAHAMAGDSKSAETILEYVKARNSALVDGAFLESIGQETGAK